MVAGGVKIAARTTIRSEEGRTTHSESEDEPPRLLFLRLAMAFTGSLALFVATLDLGLVSAVPPATRLIGAASLLSGTGLLVVAAGLLGPVLRRRALVVACLAVTLLLAAYAVWRLVHGARAGDPWAPVAIGVLALAGAGTLALTVWVSRPRS
jgi:hypothetical protein